MADYYHYLEQAEQLRHETADEAIEEHLDAICPNFEKTITVYAWARDKITQSVESLADDVVEHLYESLDDDYGDFDGDNTEPDQAVYDAAKVFVEAALKSYQVWRCSRSPGEDVTINVAQWIREHKTEWLSIPRVLVAVEALEKEE